MNQSINLGPNAAMSVSKPTASHVLLDTLLSRGVEVVFGIPGGAIGAVYDACADRPEIRVVTTRHETAAVFAAMGWARATGKPAAVLVTSGPGFTNALTGMAAAHCEQLPVVVIAGENATHTAGRFALQDGSHEGVDVLSMARPVTRFSARIARADGIEGIVHRALSAATGDPAGPVLLSIPLDVSRQKTDPQSFHMVPSSPPTLVPVEACGRAAAILSEARRPLLVLGSGARSKRAAELAVILAERTGAMVTATAHAKGVFPESHPNYLGVLGFGGHPGVRAYARDADVIAVIGSRLGDISTSGWTAELASSRALIHVDRAPSSIGRSYRADLAIVSEAETAIEAILRALPADTIQPKPAGRSLDLEHDESRRSARSPIKPQAFMASLQRIMPADTIYTVDVGEHAAFAIHHLLVESADRFHVFTGLGSMGSGLCAAIGLKVARPSTPVVSIVGDGGFAMHAGEVLTCVDEEIPVVFAVVNNGGYGMVDAGNRHIYGRACPGLPKTMADICGVARGWGAIGMVIRCPEDLNAAVREEIVRASRPVVLDVRIDAREQLSVASRLASLKHFSTGGAQ